MKKTKYSDLQFTCLHCELGETIDKHKWKGNLSTIRIKLIIIKDLIHVVWDLLFHHNNKFKLDKFKCGPFGTPEE
jgi:hypothetical protein